MIERAVFSYFNPDESFDNTAGFREFEDFLYTMSLAVAMSARQFSEVQVMSSVWGVNLFRELGLPVTEYSIKLEDMKKVSRSFWAYGKLIAYASQSRPFVHIDNDIFLWDPLPKRILESELCFQSKEQFDLPGYGWYDMLRPCWAEAQVRPQIVVNNEVTDFAYNCGICGGYNMDFFKKWKDLSTEYIFAEENQNLFFSKFKRVLSHQNLFHEQYFAASLVKYYNMRSRVEVIADYVDDISKVMKYTHLWGTTKRDKSMMIRVKNRLQKEEPELFSKVESFVVKNLHKQELVNG